MATRTMSDRAILDLPEMDGLHWIPSHEVAQEVYNAWPFTWEARTSEESLIVRWAPREQPPPFLKHPYEVRPLRLPGMDESGIIKGSDMTLIKMAAELASCRAGEAT